MAEPTFISYGPSYGPLQGLAPGHYGASEGAAGLGVRVRTDIAVWSLAARRGRQDELADALSSVLGVRPPSGPAVASAAGVHVMGIGPARWLALLEGPLPAGIAARLAEAARGNAAMTLQTDAWAILELTGPRRLEVLTKGVPVDLDPAVFTPGSAASTVVAYMPVHLARPAPAPDTILLLVARSMAESLWSWLLASAATYGVEVTG